MSDMTYREKREARAERLRVWAEKRQEKAQAAHDSATEIADSIPFGQPILVGHHSESRSRKVQEQLHNRMGQSIEHSAKADAMLSKAENIEAATKHAIYNDDPDAVQRIQERIANAEAIRDEVRGYNASVRKGRPDESLLSDQMKKNLREMSALRGVMRADGQFPTFYTSNLAGNINRLKKRLSALMASRPSS